MRRVCTIIKRRIFLTNLILLKEIGICLTPKALKNTKPIYKNKSNERSLLTFKEKTRLAAATKFLIWTLMTTKQQRLKA